MSSLSRFSNQLHQQSKLNKRNDENQDMNGADTTPKLNNNFRIMSIDDNDDYAVDFAPDFGFPRHDYDNAGDSSYCTGGSGSLYTDGNSYNGDLSSSKGDFSDGGSFDYFDGINKTDSTALNASSNKKQSSCRKLHSERKKSERSLGVNKNHNDNFKDKSKQQTMINDGKPLGIKNQVMKQNHQQQLPRTQQRNKNNSEVNEVMNDFFHRDKKTEFEEGLYSDDELGTDIEHEIIFTDDDSSAAKNHDNVIHRNKKIENKDNKTKKSNTDISDSDFIYQLDVNTVNLLQFGVAYSYRDIIRASADNDENQISTAGIAAMSPSAIQSANCPASRTSPQSQKVPSKYAPTGLTKSEQTNTFSGSGNDRSTSVTKSKKDFFSTYSNLISSFETKITDKKISVKQYPNFKTNNADKNIKASEQFVLNQQPKGDSAYLSAMKAGIRSSHGIEAKNEQCLEQADSTVAGTQLCNTPKSVKLAVLATILLIMILVAFFIVNILNGEENSKDDVTNVDDSKNMGNLTEAPTFLKPTLKPNTITAGTSNNETKTASPETLSPSVLSTNLRATTTIAPSVTYSTIASTKKPLPPSCVDSEETYLEENVLLSCNAISENQTAITALCHLGTTTFTTCIHTCNNCYFPW